MNSRIILVTGANGGLGQAIARAFLQESPANFVFLGIRSRREHADQLALENPGRCSCIALDVASAESWKQALKQILAGQKSQFYRCVADKMLTYAIGRGMEASDKRTLDNIVTDMQKHGEKFSAMVKAVAHSDAFQKRRGVQNTDLPSPANSTKISQN